MPSDSSRRSRPACIVDAGAVTGQWGYAAGRALRLPHELVVAYGQVGRVKRDHPAGDPVDECPAQRKHGNSAARAR